MLIRDSNQVQVLAYSRLIHSRVLQLYLSNPGIAPTQVMGLL